MKCPEISYLQRHIGVPLVVVEGRRGIRMDFFFIIVEQERTLQKKERVRMSEKEREKVKERDREIDRQIAVRNELRPPSRCEEYDQKRKEKKVRLRPSGTA